LYKLAPDKEDLLPQKRSALADWPSQDDIGVQRSSFLPVSIFSPPACSSRRTRRKHMLYSCFLLNTNLFSIKSFNDQLKIFPQHILSDNADNEFADNEFP